MDNKTAKLIMLAVNDIDKNGISNKLITFSEAKHMKEVQSCNDGTDSIYSLQKNNLTILVRVSTIIEFDCWKTKFAQVQFIQ